MYISKAKGIFGCLIQDKVCRMNDVHKESCIDAIDIAAKTCFSLHSLLIKAMFILQTKSSKSL